MMRLIQISNLPDSFDGFVLRRLFEAYGAVRSASVCEHYETGRSTGVGFVEMGSEQGGAAAIAALDHREHGGRVLSVSWSESSEARAWDHNGILSPIRESTDDLTSERGSNGADCEPRF